MMSKHDPKVITFDIEELRDNYSVVKPDFYCIVPEDIIGDHVVRVAGPELFCVPHPGFLKH